ncbi:MAG: AMP-binding protein [Terracidiphilus sp.]|nr:AMP-binding protein [Terracidiphilus sp.]
MFSKDIHAFSDRVLIETDTGEHIHYCEVGEWADQLKAKVAARSLVFCLADNSIGSIAGYLAFMTVRIVPLLLSVGIDQQLLQHLLTLYRPQFIWQPQGCLTCGKQARVVLRLSSYELVEWASEPVDLHPDLGLLLSTSGSTGSPKLVRLSYRNVESNADSIASYLNLSKNERPITSLPSHYSYGLSVINSHFHVGATLLATNASVVQREFWEFARQAKASSIAGVPYTYEMLRRLRFFSMELPDLHTMTQAGGHFPKERVKEYLEYAKSSGKAFIVMYGQTEATARMSYLPFSRAEEKLGSVGIAIPGGRFQLLHDDGKEILEPSVTGNLVYSGPNVSLGYAQSREDLGLEDERCGVLETGDLAYRDPDDFYFIQGRKNRFVKIYGNRVNLDEVEALVRRINVDCACVGQEDMISVYVTSAESQELVQVYLAEKTGLNRRAFNVRVVQSIPKTAAGKTQYSQLSVANI